MTTISPVQRIVTGLLVAALALFGAACGDDDDESAGSQSATTAATATTLATTTTAAPNVLTIQNFTFMGIDNTRAVSGTWTITNSDTVPHTVSAVDGSFVWRVEPGQTTPFTRTLAAGSYPIKCDIHPTRMTGTLVVK